MFTKLLHSVSNALTGEPTSPARDGEDTTVEHPTRTGRAGAVEGGAEADASATGEPRSNLYQCPSCSSIFVALEKERCETCRTAVERVE